MKLERHWYRSASAICAAPRVTRPWVGSPYPSLDGPRLIGGELGRGPLRLPLQPSQRVVDRDRGAVQVRPGLVERVRGREPLGILVEQIGAGAHDQQRGQPEGGGDRLGASHGGLLLAQKVTLTPKFHIRACG